MKCPICGQELRPGKKDPNYLLCYNCKKKFKIPQSAHKVQKRAEKPEPEEQKYSNIPPKEVREKREQEMRDAYDELLAVGDGKKKKKPAPKPQRIVEIETVRALTDAGQVVIAAGGGGIPVMEQGINLHGASAIIEKDFASGLLAEELNADTLLILTSVEKVSLNKDTDHETYLGALSAEEAQKYIDEGQFAAGSMLPKIEAGLSFLSKGENRRAIITDIAHAKDGYREKTGTIIK